MKRLSIILLTTFMVVFFPGIFNVHAAEVSPETGTISYTGNETIIELTDVNAGSDGNLYITDKNNAVAVALDPLTGEYKVYILQIAPGDAGDVQRAPDGRVWYSDNATQVGVFDPANCGVGNVSCPGKVWEFPPIGDLEEKINIGPLTFDDQGRVWVGDFGGNANRLYRASYSSGDLLQYCPYDIGIYRTHDLKFYQGAIWFSDYFNHRILRFVTGSEILTAWQLDGLADPDGIVFDGSGGLWWSEISGQRIGHMTEGETDTLTYYTIPGDAQPEAITIHNAMVWYTDKNGKVGMLDPATAVPTSSVTITEQSMGQKLTTCSNLNRAIPVSADYYETKTLLFNAFNPVLIPDTSTTGWTIYSLPGGSIPFGIAAQGDYVFVTDANKTAVNVGKMIRFTQAQSQFKVFLPLIRK